MAQYRLSLAIASRKSGRSATSMAAYRAGVEMTDERTGLVFDYTRKPVLHSQIVLPEGAPDWARDRAVLWNRSEMADRRADAQIAREVQLSLPHELSQGERRDLTLDFAGYLVGRFGIAVDVAIHPPDKAGDQRNHHAHLLLCTRPFDGDKESGFGNKNRELDFIAQRKVGRSPVVEEMRETWAGMLNERLVRADVRDGDGVQVVVDHRSYERLGIDREPTVKLGPAASRMDRRGEEADRAQTNEEVQERNGERDELSAQIEAEAAELIDILASVKRSPLDDQIRFKYRESPVVQAAFAAVDELEPGSLRVQPAPRLLILEEEMREQAALAGEDEPNANDVLHEFGRRSRAERREDAKTERDARPINKLIRALNKREDAGDDGTGEGERVLQREAQRRVDQAEEERAMRSYETSYEIAGGDEAERVPQRDAQRQVDRDKEERAMRYYENATREDGEQERPERLDTDPLPDADPPSQPWRWRGLDALNGELSEPFEDEREKKRGDGDRQLTDDCEVLDTDPEPDERQSGGPGWDFGFGR